MAMLIHIVPRLYTPLPLKVRLVDLTVDEIGLVLNGDQELTLRRPYPNKCYWVGCRKIGQKAIAGLFIEFDHFLSAYTVTTRWAINASVVLTHRVDHIVLDSKFDAVSDDMILWYGTGESLGGWSSRWPNCYADQAPVRVQPRMDALAPDCGGTARKGDVRDTYSCADPGWVLRREERFQVPTLERGRFLGKFAECNRLPPLAHAFTCEADHAR